MVHGAWCMVHGRKQPVLIIERFLNPSVAQKKSSLGIYTEGEILNFSANSIGLPLKHLSTYKQCLQVG